jgi:signal transduction histidine kinase
LEERVKERTLELRAVNAELRKALAEQRRLEAEVIEASTREQQRIGQDLHDGLCQQLVGLEWLGQSLMQELQAARPAAARRAARMVEEIRTATAQARRLVRGLFPVELSTGGLPEWLQALADRTEKLFQVACAVECDRLAAPPDRVVSAHLYWIAKEAVHNAIKHGKADQIRICFNQDGAGAVLSVGNNGRPFPKSPPRKRGLGLQLMQARAAMIGAILEFQGTRPSQRGTTLICRLNADRNLFASPIRMPPRMIEPAEPTDHADTGSLWAVVRRGPTEKAIGG